MGRARDAHPRVADGAPAAAVGAQGTRRAAGRGHSSVLALWDPVRARRHLAQVAGSRRGRARRVERARTAHTVVAKVGRATGAPVRCVAGRHAHRHAGAAVVRLLHARRGRVGAITAMLARDASAARADEIGVRPAALTVAARRADRRACLGIGVGVRVGVRVVLRRRDGRVVTPCLDRRRSGGRVEAAVEPVFVAGLVVGQRVRVDEVRSAGARARLAAPPRARAHHAHARLGEHHQELGDALAGHLQLDDSLHPGRAVQKSGHLDADFGIRRASSRDRHRRRERHFARHAAGQVGQRVPGRALLLVDRHLDRIEIGAGGEPGGLHDDLEPTGLRRLARAAPEPERSRERAGDGERANGPSHHGRPQASVVTDANRPVGTGVVVSDGLNRKYAPTTAPAARTAPPPIHGQSGPP